MQKKIIVSTILSVLVILLGLGIISNISIHDSIRRSLNERAELAGMLANYTDHLLQDNLTRLFDISLSGAIDLNDGDNEAEYKALKTAYQYSIFTEGIFLLDLQGNIVLTYPAGQIKRNLMGVPYVRRTIEENKAVISGIHTEEGTGRKVIFVLVPLQDRDGNTIGAVGAEINPTNYILGNIIHAAPIGPDTIIELVDASGVVIASNNPVRIGTCSDRNRILGNLIATRTKKVMECHRCHEGGQGGPGRRDEKTVDMLAFAPLTEAPWGISVRDSQSRVYAPSSTLRRRFVILGLVSIGSALILALGVSRGLVLPIRSLTFATERIAQGNLKEPVSAVSPRDEIGILSRSFELMRRRLADSLEKIQRSNAELEERVLDRTKELQQSRRRLTTLLNELMRAQEDERKRIARELHDETSQSIAALGMSIEIAAIALKENELTPQKIYELRAKVTQLLEGISRIIQDLRPPVLDDLGLESAIRWLLQRHIAEKGAHYTLTVSDEFQGHMGSDDTLIDSKTVFRLFRIIQEAVINISKHAEASQVSVALDMEDGKVRIEISDDGVGFNVDEVLLGIDMGVNAGYGILGLKERVALLEGTINIVSAPGEGTQVTISIPLSSLEIRDV